MEKNVNKLYKKFLRRPSPTQFRQALTQLREFTEPCQSAPTAQSGSAPSTSITLSHLHLPLGQGSKMWYNKA